MRSAPSVWQGIRVRIEALTKNYQEVREALPRTDDIAGSRGGRWDAREFFAKIDPRLGRRRGELCVGRSVAYFCVGQPAATRSCVPGARAGSLSRESASHSRAADATNDRMCARRGHQRCHHRPVHRRVALADWRATGAHVRGVRVSG